MTPKEKAKELVEKFYWRETIFNVSVEDSKKCALIAAIEVKFAYMQIADYENAAYWRAVELEIEKL